MDRAFKGVWIPRDIWLNEELSIMEKLFLVRISSLDGEYGCYAGNNHFKDFFRLSKTRCSGIINSLKDKGYINIKMFYKLDKKTVEKRIIRVNENKLTQEIHDKQWSQGMQEIQQFEDKQELQDIADIKEYQHQLEMQNELVDLGMEEVLGRTGEGSIKKVSGEGESISTEKVKEKSKNKHSYEASDDTGNENNDKSSEEYSSKPSGRPVYRDVIEYLNKLCKSKYNYKSPKNQKLINARVKEGYSFEDFHTKGG